MPAASRPQQQQQQQQQQQTTVRTTGHQEVTLSEFYQLLQFVGQARGVGAGNPQSSSSSAIVSSDPPAASALSNAGSTTATTTPGKAATATETGVRSMASTPLPPSSSSQHPLPPGYLTARSFRQSTTTTTTTTANNNNGAAKRPGTADSSAERCAAPLPTQRRSHSVEVNYDNYLMSNTQRPATAAPAPISSSSSSSNHTLKTRSLPRTQPVETGAAAAAPPPARSTPIPTPVRHWAEILALITQVLSGADQYSNAAAAAASCPTRQQTGEMAGKRRRPGGDSLSDSEEAYLRRRQTESSTASPTTRDRHYDSLRTPRPSSRASVNENAGGHQSYLASLSQRLQIEQYIVKTLTHLTKSTTADKSSDASSSDAGSNSYIECWGSPERSRTPSIGSNVGLERALLRLDQRRTERQPRIYQHHHWRITPAECNALFLCKV